MLLKPSEKTPMQQPAQPVSIIICARDEAANLQKNLPAILSQQYKNTSGDDNYEVIIVDDASTDNTLQILDELQKQYPNLRSVRAGRQRTLKGKKHALGVAVQHASYNWLLLTDADCAPAGELWLQCMVAPLAKGKEIVAGYGGYYAAPSLLNAFIRWETIHTWLQYTTYAWSGLPYMAVGRNMACRKEVLIKAQQHKLWNKLPSGDDDLLITIAGNAHNMATVSNRAAHTYSASKITWREWAKQKQRHLSTGKYYKPSVKLLLALYAASHAVMWLSFITFLCLGNWVWPPIIMGIRCSLYWLLWAWATTRLQEKDNLLLFPFFDMGWLIYNFTFLPYITWKNKTQWT